MYLSRQSRTSHPQAAVAMLAVVAWLGLFGAAPQLAGAAPPPGPGAPSVWGGAGLGDRAACPAPAPGYSSCLAVLGAQAGAHPAITPNTAPAGFGAPALQAAYNLPSATAGAGQTVAVVDAYDDPNAEADLNAYRAQYGLSACTTANGCFTKVNQQGASSPLPSPNSGWAVEISLDLDMVSAVCPQCHILLVEAISSLTTDLSLAVNQAATLGAHVISNSYGTPEFGGQYLDAPGYHHPGVAITAASGDSGYGYGIPMFPSNLDTVTAVGGTSLSSAPTTTRGWSEQAWSGTTSGCSAYVAKPRWQTDKHCPTRTVADVSAVADPNTGVAAYDTYPYYAFPPGWFVVGGTSVGAPLIAGVYALAGNSANITGASRAYSHRSALNDVVRGSNGRCGDDYLCTARDGYDGPTGLGTPQGTGAF